MASTAPLGSQPQPGLLSSSRFHNLNGGTFYNTAGDAHIYNSTINPTTTKQLAHLHRFVAESALHDSNERFPQPKCHPCTRERLVQRILNWAKKDSVERILWLSGSAGMGKSAIAQTVAERCEQNGCLAAAFFFFRGNPERNTSARLVATLAYQITLFVPGACEFIIKAIEDDPALFSKDINSQLFHLIVRPVALAAREWVSMHQFLIILDGLDECVDEKQQSDILSAVSNTLTTRELPLHFLIASRPEYHIRAGFERTDLRSSTIRFDLDMDSTAWRDIEIYLEKEFSRIHEEHRVPKTPWPPNGVIQSLVERASGQFIYASTIIKFLDDRHFQPQKRLAVVLRALPQGTFSELDLLYTQILDTVLNKGQALPCLGTILFIARNHYPLHGCSTSLEYLDKLFQLNPGGVEHLLMDLHSVLNVQSEVSIRHQSFSDFLTDKDRSGDYFIDEEDIHAKFSGLLWKTIPRWLNQFEDFDSVPETLEMHYHTPLYSAINSWKSLLPECRHASGILGELSTIADLAEKKVFDIRFALGKPSNKKWHDLYPVIISWLYKEKLNEQNPTLWDKYIKLYDKAILHFLEKVNFLDPIHSIHFFVFKKLRYLDTTLIGLGIRSHLELFDDFFSDPSRSGEYYLTPQDRADIVVWMIQYYPPCPQDVFMRFQCGDSGANSKMTLVQFLPLVTQSFDDMPIDIHLSRASRCAETLVDLICLHNPDTFLAACCKVYQTSLRFKRQAKFYEQYTKKVNKAMARYLLGNSQIYEESIIQIPSFPSHKGGMVSLLPVVGYLLMLTFYFKFQWIIFPSSAPSGQCSCSK